MRTVRTKIYKFEELTKEAQQKAIENYRNDDFIHLDMFNDDAAEKIIEAGFYDDVKIQYSFSYSQGDGLSFEAKRIESKILLQMFAEILGTDKEKTAKVIIENCSFKCTGNTGNHYCYASRNDVYFEFDDYSANKPNIHELVSKVETKLKDLYMSICAELEKQGYAEIEYQRSDEYITEKIIANDYEFTKDGNIF